jgi:hypothetical protein
MNFFAGSCERTRYALPFGPVAARADSASTQSVRANFSRRSRLATSTATPLVCHDLL